MKLYYRVFGEGDPVLILHGLFGNSDNWMPIADRLAQSHRVYLPDMRNHGRSPHDPVFSLESMVEDIYEFITDLGLRKISLIGHSMGGMITMNFAFEYPHRVNRMVVIDIAPRPYPVIHDELLSHLQALDLTRIRRRRDADQILARNISSQRIRQFLLKNLYRQEDGRYNWRLNLPVIAENLDQIRKGVLKPHRINIPALFIRGGASDYIRDDDIAALPELFEDYRVETIAGASHWVHSEAPDELFDLISGFFS